MSKEDIQANLPCDCDKDWADWVVSLYHENPSNIREAVELIACEAIAFGGDMGPDGNEYNGIDNGVVNSNSLIDKWTGLVYEALQRNMQMSDEPKRCPHCGGKAHVAEGLFHGFRKRYQVWHICEGLPVGDHPNGHSKTYPKFTTPWYEDKETAIKVWNMRVEQTCSIIDLDTGNIADYECREHIKHCKNCHHAFGYVLYNEDGDTWMNEQPCYCPRCGVKVVECENG